MGVGVIVQFLEHKSCGILTRTVWSVVVGHAMLAIHIVHSLETYRAGTISRQIIVLSEHLFTLKGNELEIYLYCTVTAWIMPTLCPFLTVSCRVGLQSVIVSFLDHTLSILKLN